MRQLIEQELLNFKLSDNEENFVRWLWRQTKKNFDMFQDVLGVYNFRRKMKEIVPELDQYETEHLLKLFMRIITKMPSYETKSIYIHKIYISDYFYFKKPDVTHTSEEIYFAYSNSPNFTSADFQKVRYRVRHRNMGAESMNNWERKKVSGKIYNNNFGDEIKILNTIKIQ